LAGLSGPGVSKPLAGNDGLAASDEVYLKGNPLDARSVNDFIPRLKKRGVEVSW